MPGNARFTPGPWKLVDRSAFNVSANDAKWEIDQESGQNQFWVALAITEANAHLIAAAPDLLEACKRVQNIVLAYASPAAYQRLIDAIAKAEGNANA